ncbi:MAG: hypothetical protein JXB47_15855 [Anaerolineae bacterium]|nr:hypothetical protein [Anaerolineae bacterium]
MAMTSRECMLAALNREQPDRLPVTTHHVMEYFLEKYMDGIGDQEFFDYFGLDAYIWTLPLKGTDDGKVWIDEAGFVASDDWQITVEETPDLRYTVRRFTVQTPKGTLTTTIQTDDHKSPWVTEHLVKNKRDIDLLGEFMPAPVCDVAAVNRVADQIGERGLCRGHIVSADIFGQPGTWQDVSCQYGIQQLIMETYDDPQWVHAFEEIMYRRKLAFIRTLAGARYDVLELGGGDASTTVISPRLFQEFVAPYDSKLIAAAHEAGQRIVYHTCGGMMPILEAVAETGADAMETFTPPEMGGDVDLAEAKRRIGDRVCMIGGFDQFHYFTGCRPEDTRAAVRRAFETAGAGGGYILSPSDHFFDADLELIAAFADEAKQCVY